MLAPILSFVGALLGVLAGSWIKWITAKKELAAKFNIVALEERLKAHQKAFFLWDRFSKDVFAEDAEVYNKSYKDAYNFWFNNCLYLLSQARAAYHSLLHDIPLHRRLLKERGDTKTIENLYAKIQDAGKKIVEPIDAKFAEKTEIKGSP